MAMCEQRQNTGTRKADGGTSIPHDGLHAKKEDAGGDAETHRKRTMSL